MSAYPFGRVSKAEYKAVIAKIKARKAKRAEKRLELAASPTPPHAPAASQDATGGAIAPQNQAMPLRAVKRGKGAKPKKKVPARKAAFKRLKDLCRDFVLLRAKHRTGGFCEVAVQCQGRGPIEVPYHVTPQALGNALKYDDRNMLGSCRSCNGSEYFARKRGSNIYRDRHAAILGPEFPVLEAQAGRKKISTVEAIEMGDSFKARIEAGQWRVEANKISALIGDTHNGTLSA